MPNPVNPQDFARRVEDLCDFLLLQMKKDGSDDVVIIQELKDDAANLHIQLEKDQPEITVKGLGDFIRGLPTKET